jgi:hypothetical protein
MIRESEIRKAESETKMTKKDTQAAIIDVSIRKMVDME